MALLGLVLLGTSVNFWWIARWRKGLPFDIDEAGYLMRAFRDAGYLRHGGLISLVSHFVAHSGIRAPVLPELAGLVQFFTGAKPYQLLYVVDFFYCLVIVATYAMVRTKAEWPWALLAGGVVAAVPGVLQWARDFVFALPAASCIALALALQLWAGAFDSRKRSVIWGLAVGLSTLTRTMVLGMLPGILVAALIRLVTQDRVDRSRSDHTSRLFPRMLNAAIGLAIGSLFAATWYVHALGGVLHYLIGFGYGSHSANYGPARALFSWAWWTDPLGLTVNTELFMPLTLAIIVILVLAFAQLVRSLVRRRNRTSLDSQGAMEHIQEDRAVSVPTRATRWLATDTATLTVFLALAYLALASTRNQGSGFELILVPPTIALTVRYLSAVTRPGRMFGAFALIVAGALSFTDQAGLLPGGINDLTTVNINGFNAIAFDGRGYLFTYASAVFGGCPTIVTCYDSTKPITEYGIVHRWVAPPVELARVLHRYAASHGREPVVLFAVQDPFVNVNSVALDAIDLYHREWPIGVLSKPSAANASYKVQLSAPRFGEPNFVLIGPPSKVPAARSFSPLQSDSGVAAAAKADGFRRIGGLRLPDGRTMGIWWHPDRGPTLPRI